MEEIAVIGMACRYPDARSTQELWENVLAQRQAFRRFPAERLRVEDYVCQDKTAPDMSYASLGAFIDDYKFDRVHYRISGNAYRSSDLVHWLALDIAAQTLADAGFASPGELPTTTTGVIVGNTLTGEFSRAHALRLRWPYVRRVVAAALREEGWNPQRCQTFLSTLEDRYKEPFAPVGEETLAGGLSNTIAGRICNYFDLKGGGYTVDGACASSLLAIATACSALSAGEIDLALAGGVDLSLDPFELIGFAKTAALATDIMRVYDRRSNGFLPGEGCGFVALMRYEDALAQRRRIYALIRGWGISSDGSGGITRPEAEGQLLALERAYHRAGVGIDSVVYFEGHGTGTSVGDTTELQALSRARRQARTHVPPAAIGSIKANIGHTKAAAGVAGFIKTTMALFSQVIPPTTGTAGVFEPHAELTTQDAVLMVPASGTAWPADLPLRAGVSAMGFGGINTHVLLEGISSKRRSALSAQERDLLASAQDVELFLLAGQDQADVQRQVAQLLSLAPRLSRAELTDLALHLMRTLQPGPLRVAVVAATPAELASRLEHLETLLAQGTERYLNNRDGIFLGQDGTPPHIGFLFPGQGAPVNLQGGLLRRRFEVVADLYTQAQLPGSIDGADTRVAQPAIVTASLAALRLMQRLGLRAAAALGHSLGELTALHWAGAFDEETLMRLASVRGQVMGNLGHPSGAMLSIMAPPEVVQALIQGEEAVIAGFNTPRQTVISGTDVAIAAVAQRARARNLHTRMLHVSHAFHSPLVSAAAEPFAAHLAEIAFHPLQGTVFSTVTGSRLNSQTDPHALLREQITAPVRFVDAVNGLAAEVDLLVEVGPGQILSSLAADCVSLPTFAIDAGGPSLKGLFHMLGAAYVLGAPLDTGPLCDKRFGRPFDLNWQKRFFANPCEQAPLAGADLSAPQRKPAGTGAPPTHTDDTPSTPIVASSTTDHLRHLIAERAELPMQAIGDTSRMLTDLHLNSITVSQIVSEAARALGLLPPIAPTEYADASVSAIALALDELKQTGGTPDLEEQLKNPPGIDTWVRPFQVEYIECSLSISSQHASGPADWLVLAPPDHPLREKLQQACAQETGAGVLVCLPASPDERHISLLLEGAREALKRGNTWAFVLVQDGGGGAGLARTLYLEGPKRPTCVVDVPFQHPQAVQWVMAEIRASRGYSEAVYDTRGVRRTPVLKLLPLPDDAWAPLSLGPADVLLVTGGGKGIAAECALALACETGVRLVLLGRSHPSLDRELAENLSRFTASSVDFSYLSVDVTDAEAVQRELSAIQAKLGPITALLHGAGTNTPRLLSVLSEEEVSRTLAPKVRGLQSVLSALDPANLRVLVTFGSIIARTGMRGEADYALANDWLASLTEAFQAEHPWCRCLCLEWSVWAGTGMGERLGTIEALMREGITPIPLDKGIASFQRLIQYRLPDVRVVVASRFGTSPTLSMPAPELPFLRFLEQPRISYPGIELIIDGELATATDPYLEDHQFRGERLLPAVVGLEAMAQVAMALAGQRDRPHFELVELERPVVVPARGSLKIRLAALVRESGKIDVALRSEETAFQADHFRAACSFTRQPLTALERLRPLRETEQMPLPLEPARDLYGSILFHQGRFQRIRGYSHLRATECIAELSSAPAGNLFVHYLPPALVLGDFTTRDAVIHCIQTCIPHKRLLPVSVEEILFAPDLSSSAGGLRVYARERCQCGDLFTYDVEVRTARGELAEQWRGLRLRQVEEIAPSRSWPGALLGPYLERRLSEFFPTSTIQLVIAHAVNPERRAGSDQAFQRLLGSTAAVRRRPDGRPVLPAPASLNLSASHAGHWVLAIASKRQVGCDLEPVSDRPPSLWQELLGRERYQLALILAREANEELNIAATRLWAAAECLKKAGALMTAPLVFDTLKGAGWALLRAGSFRIATYVTTLREEDVPVALAICSDIENDPPGSREAHEDTRKEEQPGGSAGKRENRASL